MCLLCVASLSNLETHLRGQRVFLGPRRLSRLLSAGPQAGLKSEGNSEQTEN